MTTAKTPSAVFLRPQRRIGTALKLSLAAALLALSVLSRETAADIPDTALLEALDDCTIVRTSLVDVEEGSCEYIPEIVMIKRCTATLFLKRNASFPLPVPVPRQGPYGSVNRSVKHDSGSTTIVSGVAEQGCAGMFDLVGISGGRTDWRTLPYPNVTGTASIVRTTCPATSFGAMYAQSYIAMGKIFPSLEGPVRASGFDLEFVAGDEISSLADADVQMSMKGAVMDGQDVQRFYRQTCLARYKVTSGNCFFGGARGKQPSCSSSGGDGGGGGSTDDDSDNNHGDGGGGGGGGGASGTSSLPSVGTAALLVLSVLAVAVVGIAGVAATR